MKKLIALCILSGVLLGSVIGCGGSPTTKPAAPPAPGKGGPGAPGAPGGPGK